MSLVFETERMRIRQFTGADRDHFFLLNGNIEIMRFIRPVKSKEESDVFLNQVMEDARRQPLYGRWAVEEKLTGVFLGSFALIPVENSDQMQLGYALFTQHWGKGLATELTRYGLEYAFTKTPLDILYAYVEKPNVASARVLLKAGFFPDGEKSEKGKLLDGFVISREQWRLRNG